LYPIAGTYIPYYLRNPDKNLQAEKQLDEKDISRGTAA
jgi:hypothetical protein